MPPQTPHYWCHQCQQEVQVLMAPDPVCQRCNGQFVEQIEAENDPRDFTNPIDEENPTIGSAPGSYYTLNSGGPNTNIFQIYDSNPSNAPETGGGALYGMLQALLNGSLPTQTEQQERTSNISSNASNSSNANADVGQATTGGGDGTRVGRYRQPVMFMGSFGADGGVRFRTVQGDTSSQMPGSFQETQNSSINRTESPRAAEGRDPSVRGANMINLIQMISGLSGTPISLNFGGSANPGDYVFSQTGLDNIITQLMEQANSEHAPPPASEEMIEALDKQKLKESDLEKFSHCAICTDDFTIDEEIVVLPCEHAYHGDCITPWLKVNGTCPVCRYSLITGLKPKDQPGHESSESTTSTQASTSNQTEAPTQSTAQTNVPPSTMSDPMSWESTIPGAFTWGPGGDSQRQPDHPNTDNTNSNDTANNNNSSTGESQNSSTNVLDLD